MKPGQRKILYSCFKRNLKKEIKVAQLSGYVAEHSAYHHGEKSLADTIVGMAQNFVGSNNISYLVPKGQFGSRALGGKDAASARYIYTFLTDISRLLFHKHDRYLLNYLNEEGQSIEPEYYIPVLPTILVNGAEGIGTGWSTNIPCFDPSEIIEALEKRMEGTEFTRLTPWYKHFKGDIIHDGKSSFVVSGKFYIDRENKCARITELPVKKWTKDYKKFLESYIEKEIISDMQEHHPTNQVDFEIFFDKKENYYETDEAFIKHFKLQNTISDNNYVLFNHENRLKRYLDETEIMEEFYNVREDLYEKRKGFLIRRHERDLDIYDNQVRFIRAVIDGDIVVRNRKRKDLLLELFTKGFSKKSDIEKRVPEEHKNKGERDQNEDEDNDQPRPSVDDMDQDSIKAEDYNYLLGMPIWSLTAERIAKLEQDKADKEKLIAKLKMVHIHDMWREDLEAVKQELNKINKKELDLMKKSSGKGGKGNKKGKAKQKKLSNMPKTDLESELKKKRPPPPPKKTGFIKAKKGKQDTTTNDTSSSVDIAPINIDDLPLRERLRMQEKMQKDGANYSLKTDNSHINYDSIEDSKMETEEANDSEEEIVETNTRKSNRKKTQRRMIIDDSEDSIDSESSYEIQ